MRRSSDLHEGAVFLIPLPTSGFGVGVLVRSNGKGQAFGAFFGPRIESADQVAIDDLRPDLAILTCRFGDYGLFNGRWPVVGKIKDWDSNRWPLPNFVRAHDQATLRYLSEYNDRLELISENVVNAMSVSKLPEDVQYGSGVVEMKMGKLLCH